MKIKLKAIIFLVGLIIISLIFWNRFIRVREDVDILSIDSNIKIFFICITFIMFGYIFIINLLEILNIKITKNTFIIDLLDKNIIKTLLLYLKTFSESPVTVLEFIYEKTPIRIFVERYATYLPYYIEKHLFISYVIFIIIPRSLIVTTLFIDIVIFNQINFINKIIFIAIIPLMVQTSFFIIKYCGLRTIEYLNQFFDFIFDEKTNTYNLYYKCLIDEKDIETQNRSNMEYITALYCIHTSHISIIEKFYGIFDDYKPYYNCYISLMLVLISISQILIILEINYFFLFNFIIRIEEPFSGLFL